MDTTNTSQTNIGQDIDNVTTLIDDVIKLNQTVNQETDLLKAELNKLEQNPNSST